MKVLQLSDFYPPTIGGLERHVQTLAKTLVAGGDSVTVVTLGRDDLPATESHDGVDVIRMRGWAKLLDRFYADSKYNFHPTMPDHGLATQLADVVERVKPDIIHAHGWIMYSALSRRVRKLAPIVVTMHDYGLACVKKTGLDQSDTTCTGPGFTKCISCASAGYGRLKGTGLSVGMSISTPLHKHVSHFASVCGTVDRFNAAVMRDAPHSVITSFTSSEPMDPNNLPPRPSFVPPIGDYVFFAGALGMHKGVGLLNEMYRRPDRPNVPLIVAGSPRPDAPTQWADGITVINNVAHPDVMAAWAHCAVAVVPSQWGEPFPNTTLEAMAAGRAIVASRVGGIPDQLTSGVDGILLEPTDIDGWTNAINDLLARPDERKRLGDAARTTVPQFTAASVVPKIRAMYSDVLSRD